MDSFKHYITEVALQASGREAARHTAKYITPYIGKEGTHTIASKAPGLNIGDSVTIHSHHVDDQGTHHIVVSKPGSSEKITIPTSKVHKVGTKTENKGHQTEKDFFERMQKRGLTPEGATPAGSTAGSDVPVVDKRQNTTHLGRDITSQANELNGEVKKDTSAAFGQITIEHNPEKGGWHIPDRARKLRPGYADAIEKAGLIEHANKNIPEPHKAITTASGRAQNITVPHPDLQPAEAYLKDHDVDFLHIGSHGTFRVGENDATGHGLPRLTGKGLWTIRQKTSDPRKRTIQFQPHGSRGLHKSHVNLDNDDHLDEFAKTLGHGDAPAPGVTNKSPVPVPSAKSEPKIEPKVAAVNSILQNRQRVRKPILGKNTMVRRGLR
jgi:hypothetical protein